MSIYKMNGNSHHSRLHGLSNECQTALDLARYNKQWLYSQPFNSTIQHWFTLISVCHNHTLYIYHLQETLIKFSTVLGLPSPSKALCTCTCVHVNSAYTTMPIHASMCVEHGAQTWYAHVQTKLDTT